MKDVKVSRVLREFTPEEREQWSRDLAVADAENTPESWEKFRRMQSAADEPTFSGELRRAIHRVHQTRGFFLPELMQRSQITWNELQPFLLGEASLPTDAVDRLVHELGLHLQTEIAVTVEEAE